MKAHQRDMGEKRGTPDSAGCAEKAKSGQTKRQELGVGLCYVVEVRAACCGNPWNSKTGLGVEMHFGAGALRCHVGYMREGIKYGTKAFAWMTEWGGRGEGRGTRGWPGNNVEKSCVLNV